MDSPVCFLERSMIRENVTAGLARAKKHGTRSGNPIGRPRNSSERTASQVLMLRRQGWGLLPSGENSRSAPGLCSGSWRSADRTAPRTRTLMRAPPTLTVGRGERRL
jgi:hypothetical protein